MLLTPYPLALRKLQSKRTIMQFRYNFYFRPKEKASFIKRELNKYSTVKISHSSDGYRLHYGDHTNSGTGPFKTRAEAILWFARGGR